YSRETIMRDLVVKYLSKGVSRRNFVTGLTQAGLTMTAAQSVLSSVSTVTLAQTSPPAGAATGPVKTFEGTGGAAFVEQVIASGVKYVFGNSASEDAEFYEALVDRPQLKYILTPHEGPGAAMAAGDIKASGEPAMVMQAGVVGMPTRSARSSTPTRSRPRSSSIPTAPTNRAGPGATASRRCSIRSRSSSR